MQCDTCDEQLLLGFCPLGHPQGEEPSTIDEAMVAQSRTLGSLLKNARESGDIETVITFDSANN